MIDGCGPANWRRSALLGLLWVTAAGVEGVVAQVAPTAPPRSSPIAEAPAVYEPGDFYLPASRVYIFVDKRGAGHEHAVEGSLKQGSLRLDAPQNAGQLVFDMRTFAADTDAAREYLGLSGTTDPSTKRQVTAEMKGTAVLDAGQFSTATFVVRTVKKMPQPSARQLPQFQLAGDFTLHGTTQPIEAVADVEENAGWIHVRGGFTMLQTQFGIRPLTKAFGALGVADELKVYGDFWLAKQRETAPPDVESHVAK